MRNNVSVSSAYPRVLLQLHQALHERPELLVDVTPRCPTRFSNAVHRNRHQLRQHDTFALLERPHVCQAFCTPEANRCEKMPAQHSQPDSQTAPAAVCSAWDNMRLTVGAMTLLRMLVLQLSVTTSSTDQATFFNSCCLLQNACSSCLSCAGERAVCAPSCGPPGPPTTGCVAASFSTFSQRSRSNETPSCGCGCVTDGGAVGAPAVGRLTSISTRTETLAS